MTYELEPVRTQGLDVTITSDALAIPITLAEVKDHVNVDFADHDTQLTNLLASAFREVELFTQKALKTKTVRQSFKEINGTVELVYSPVQSITSVTDASNVALDYTSSIDKTKISAYSANGIKITFVAGYTSLPADLRNAVLDIVAVDFDNKVEDKRLALKSIKDRIRHYRPIYV
jgi:uncharacterized phiE125 gp8 family phage protein